MYASLRSGESMGGKHRRSNTNFDLRTPADKGERFDKKLL